MAAPWLNVSLIGHATGYSIQTSLFTDTAIRSFIDSYLSVGETVFGMLSGYAVNSRYFKRNIE